MWILFLLNLCLTDLTVYEQLDVAVRSIYLICEERAERSMLMSSRGKAEKNAAKWSLIEDQIQTNTKRMKKSNGNNRECSVKGLYSPQCVHDVKAHNIIATSNAQFKLTKNEEMIGDLWKHFAPCCLDNQLFKHFLCTCLARMLAK